MFRVYLWLRGQEFVDLRHYFSKRGMRGVPYGFILLGEICAAAGMQLKLDSQCCVCRAGIGRPEKFVHLRTNELQSVFMFCVCDLCFDAVRNGCKTILDRGEMILKQVKEKRLFAVEAGVKRALGISGSLRNRTNGRSGDAFAADLLTSSRNESLASLRVALLPCQSRHTAPLNKFEPSPVDRTLMIVTQTKITIAIKIASDI